MELVKQESNSLMQIEDTRKICESLMKTPHYSKLGPEGIYAVVSKAQSLGMNPIDALNGSLYYINGRVGMSAEAMASRMRKAGHSIMMDERSTPTCCVLRGKRGDNGDTWIASFSVEDAKKAGIYNERGPWGKYPGDMCYNRAISKMFRQLTPDLSLGVGYTSEELRDIPVVEETKVIEIPKISAEQSRELETIFCQCDPLYLEKVWKTLKKPPIAIESLEQLPANLFERIRTAALKNKEEYQASQEDDIFGEEEVVIEEVLEAKEM